MIIHNSREKITICSFGFLSKSSHGLMQNSDKTHSEITFKFIYAEVLFIKLAPSREAPTGRDKHTKNGINDSI
jgi:hypothetical protein